MKKAILNSKVEAIEIDASNCFEIKLNTSDTEEIMVKAIIEGEYEKNLILNLKEEGSNVSVSAGFAANFKIPNDKLSAHKVVSIALEIIVPEFQNVQINGTSSNVFVSGVYKQLLITLNDGICTLQNVSKKVTAVTQSGDINLKTKKAEIFAISKFGNVQKNDIPSGDSYFALTTTTGNIYLKRTD